MAEYELKPCPFCGGMALVNDDPYAVEDVEGRHWAFNIVCSIRRSGWLRRVRGGNFGARPEANREAHSEYNWRGRRHRDRENGVLREAAANGRLLSGGRGREFASLYTVGNRDAVYPRARR